MKKWIHLRALFVAGATALLLGTAGCTKTKITAIEVNPPIAVQLEPVKYSDRAVPVRATATLARTSEAELSFKVAGLIDAINVRAGDAVSEGQVLATLRLDEIEAQELQARRAWEKAQRDFDRAKRLHAANVATEENEQDAATNLDVAAAALRSVEFNRAHAVIIAPSAGRILRREAEPQEIVAVGRPILAFASDSSGWLARSGLSQHDAARVHVGDAVEITGDGLPEPTHGKVAHIADAADSNTRLTETEIALSAPLEAARSGYVVNVEIFPRAESPRVVVPASALVEGSGREATLFLAERGESIVHRARVHVGEIDGENVFLRDDLPRDGFVVVRGAEYLSEGSRYQAASD